jgi:hypothetical protein
MGFTQEQEAFIEKIAFKVGDVIEARLKEHQAESLELHAAKCVALKRLNKYIYIGMGIAIGLGTALPRLAELMEKAIRP